MTGVGDLIAQKIIFAYAAIEGIHLSVTLFNNCPAGLSQHLKVLEKPPYHSKSTDQVCQLVTSISVKVVDK
jgi:hypothetical protein